MSSKLELVTHSAEETRALGRALGQAAQPGDLFLISGRLGTGKTCLVQGLAFGLGVEEYARSPSFVIVNRYRGRLDLYHIDLYRLEGLDEIIYLGLEDYLEEPGVFAVEWADRASSLFPRESMWITMDYGMEENDRRIAMKAQGRRYRELLRLLAAHTSRAR